MTTEYDTTKRPVRTVSLDDLIRWLRQPELALWPADLTVDGLMRRAADALEETTKQRDARATDARLYNGDVVKLVAERNRLEAKLVASLPREVATVEELDALPEYTAVISRAIIWEKNSDAGWDRRIWWTVGVDVPSEPSDIALPARILFAPLASNEKDE